jgi:hypothetical protein
MYACITPLKLIMLYKEWEEYIPEDWCCHMSSSSSPVSTTDSATLQTSNHISYNLLSTHLLKVHFREVPSHRSVIVLFYSLIVVYNSQYWITKLTEPSHVSSQNFTLTLFPTFHLHPILVILEAHITPCQKLDVPTSLHVKILGLLVLYLKSIKKKYFVLASLSFLEPVAIFL